jgi:hypothetical protein
MYIHIENQFLNYTNQNILQIPINSTRTDINQQQHNILENPIYFTYQWYGHNEGTTMTPVSKILEDTLRVNIIPIAENQAFIIPPNDFLKQIWGRTNYFKHNLLYFDFKNKTTIVDSCSDQLLVTLREPILKYFSFPSINSNDLSSTNLSEFYCEAFLVNTSHHFEKVLNIPPLFLSDFQDFTNDMVVENQTKRCRSSIEKTLPDGKIKIKEDSFIYENGDILLFYKYNPSLLNNYLLSLNIDGDGSSGEILKMKTLINYDPSTSILLEVDVRGNQTYYHIEQNSSNSFHLQIEDFHGYQNTSVYCLLPSSKSVPNIYLPPLAKNSISVLKLKNLCISKSFMTEILRKDILIIPYLLLIFRFDKTKNMFSNILNLPQGDTLICFPDEEMESSMFFTFQCNQSIQLKNQFSYDEINIELQIPNENTFIPLIDFQRDSIVFENKKNLNQDYNFFLHGKMNDNISILFTIE